MSEDVQVVPKWLKELEEKREKRLKTRLGHESGAGSPCLTCEDKCPGLDLHFWRKICKNCKCGKENHDVNDDDVYGWAQFQLLGSKPNKPKRIVLPGRKDEVELEWMPKGQNDTVDLYLKELPVNLLPIKGSSAAQQRKLLLQKQIPLHDIDPTLCHALSETEVKQMNDYIAHVKQNSVGVGHVMKLDELLKNRQGLSAQYKSNRTPLQVPQSEHAVLQGADRAQELVREQYARDDLPKSLEDLQVTLKELCPNLPLHSVTPHTDKQNPHLPTLRDLNYQLRKNDRGSTDVYAAETRTFNPNATGNPLPSNYPSCPYANQIDNQSSQSVNAPKDLHMQMHALKSNNDRHKPIPKRCLPNQTSPVGQFHSDAPQSHINYAQFSSVAHPRALANINHPNQPFANKIDNQPPTDIRTDDPQSHYHESSSMPHPHAYSNVNQPNRGFSKQIDNQTAQAVKPPKDVHVQLHSNKPLHNINHPRYSSNASNPQPLNVNYPQQPFANQIHNQTMSKINPIEDLQAQLHLLLLEKKCDASPYDSKAGEMVSFNNYTKPETVYPDMNVNYQLNGLKENLKRLGVPHYAASQLNTVDNQRNPKIANLKDLAYSTYNPRYNPSELRVEEENVEPTLINVGAISDIEYSTNPIKSAEQKQNEFLSDVPRKNVPLDSNDVLPSCHKCKAMFSLDDFVIGISHSDALWHTDCFKCTGCNQSLADMMYFYHKESKEIYCGRDYAKIKGIPRCQACDELIFVKEYCLAENSTFHVKHFCCFECDLPLAGQNYVMEELQPLCVPCFEKVKAEKCNACLQIIKPDEQGANLNGVHFHANDDCFCCKTCKRGLLGAKMLFKNSNLYCSTLCFNADS